MIPLDIAGHLFSAMLVAILAFSPTLAGLIASLSRNESAETTVTVIPPEKHPVSNTFDAFDDLIRTRLHGDERYQQASATGALSAAPTVSETARIEDALVNIFCTAQSAVHVRTITGSGVFIDARGIILTNAHIAQFLLLAEEDAQTTQCIIRQGSPALSKYEVALLYISPAWITKNARQLSADQPSGTGEYDFALLYVTEAIEGDLPKSFPALVPAPATAVFNAMAVRAAGYPAETLTERNTRAPLVPFVATSNITRLFTFGSGEIDLVAIAPSTIGQQGSSGGPVVSEEGKVVGIIATRGNITQEGTRSLRALTLSYIDRMLKDETGLDLAHTLAGDVSLRALVFHDTLAPYLRTILLETQ